MKMKSLLFVILGSLIISGCGSNSGINDTVGHQDDVTRYSFNGTHIFNYSETDDYIVRNKTSNYKVLLPYELDSYLITAKDELVSLFKEATGVTLETVSETSEGMSHSKDGEYISIGNTKMFASSGLVIDKNIGSQAARLLTKDKTIYLNGGDNHGCVYAVYDLLEVLFDFDALSYDCVHLEKKDNVKFYTLDITDVPDIQARCNSWGFIKENPNNIAFRLRTPYDFSNYVMEVGDVENGATKAAIHNCLDILPRNGAESDPLWYSDAGDQICYTAHGVKQSYEAMVDRAAYVIIQYGLKAFTPKDYPLKNIVTFTMEDNHLGCKCNACLAAKAKYGEDSGQVIVFCNDLMAKIKEWMNKPENADYYRKDLKMLFFAYNYLINAPAHFDEASQKYVVNHSDLIMREDVGVYYAVSSGLNYQLNIYDEHNAEGRDMFRKWSDVASSMNLWTYNANFGAYLAHVNSTNFYAPEAYQLFAANKTELIYNQGAWNSYNLTAFQMLAIYLDAKLSWNSNLDMNALIDKWFTYMYKDAASIMKELFIEENLYAMVLYDKLGVLDSSGIINKSCETSDNWPYQMLDSWLGLIEKARNKIAIYESVDLQTYHMLKEHLDLEWISPAYYMVSLYGATYLSSERYIEMVNYFTSEILPLKFFLISERGSTLSSWILSLNQ